MQLSSIFFLSFRYLKSSKNNKLPSIGTVLSCTGVALSVATLITVMSVMNGFVDELVTKIIGTNSHITLSSYNGISNERADNVVEKLKNIKEIRYISKVVNGQGMGINTSSKSSTGMMVKGMYMDDILQRSELKNGLVYDEKCTDGSHFEKNGIFLGKYLAQALGINSGDSLSLVVSNGDMTIFGFVPRYTNLYVCGIFDTGSSLNDSATGIVSIQTAQKLFKSKDSISDIEIFLKDYSKADDIQLKILKNDIWHGYSSNWKLSNDGLFSAMKVERVAMSFILSLFLLVSMFGIFANMNNLVTTKNKNIAIMMSMGIKNSDIKKIFFICGFSIGFIGTVLGLVIGVLFTTNIQSIKGFLENATGLTIFDGAVYFLSYLPSKVIISDVVIVCICSIVCAVVSSIIPAIRASRVKIAEHLRQV